MRKLFFSFLCVLTGISFSISQQITTITGYAPDYVGKTVEVFEILDFYSMKEERIAVATVGADSSFSMSFLNPRTQKVTIRSNNNFSYLYIEPGRKYEVFMPLHDRDKPYRPLGNYVTCTFLNLDTTDINYKLLTLNHAVDQLYAANIYNFVRNKQKFLNQYKVFKDSIYKSFDAKETFYNSLVHYSFADLDMSFYTNEKAQEFIFNTYLDKEPVLYNNEYYALTVKKIYSNLFSQLSLEISNRVYLAALKKSPSLIMKALESDKKVGPSYILKDGKVAKTFTNEQLRELAMIYGLKDAYSDAEFPKTNVLEILDSISKFPKYAENGKIAANILFRLTEVTPGNPAPDFVLTNSKGELLNLKRFENSYLYLHVFKLDYTQTSQEIELLKGIYQRYSSLVKFVSVYFKGEKKTKKMEQLIQSIPWDVVEIDENDPLLKSYNIQSYPYYALIDRTGVVVSSPALGPLPNGEYLTIDKTFYDIQKMDKILEEREKERRRRGE